MEIARGTPGWPQALCAVREPRPEGRVAQTGLADPSRGSVGAVREPPAGACRFRCALVDELSQEHAALEEGFEVK